MSLPPEIPQPDNRPNTQTATAAELQKVEREMTGFERSTLRWAKVAVFMSALAALFVCLQWYEMHTSGTDTHDLAVAAKTQAEKMRDMSEAADKIRQAAEGMMAQEQRIADNAQKSLDASNRQSKAALDASIKAMRLDERAWVSVRGIGPVPELDKPWDLIVFFRNTGKTPAQRVYLSCAVDPVVNESAIKWGIPAHYEPELVPPNAETICILHPVTQLNAAQPKLTQGVLDILQREEIRMYAYGSVIYEDVFGQWHWTTFCKSMSGDGKAGSPARKATILAMGRYHRRRLTR